MATTSDARRPGGRYRRGIPRAPRNALSPSGIYHVTNRGVALCEIFRDDIDRRLFLARLCRLAPALKWKCFVYCLMTNHFHLLVATSLDDLSRGMHRLQGPYAHRFNAKYGRVGHLFQERFHTWVIRDELHFARTLEYIRNNPVVAGLCETAADWPWTGSI
jgi:REP element-mobilizing transposase RayT